MTRRKQALANIFGGDGFVWRKTAWRGVCRTTSQFFAILRTEREFVCMSVFVMGGMGSCLFMMAWIVSYHKLLSSAKG